MSDLCHQCALSFLGKDTQDLAGFTSPEAWSDGKAAIVICDGCGAIQVDPDGKCVSKDCLYEHGLDD